uniref:Uncharacterized protein n=1 Tax=Magallana gigas TaxID=29159 RepID=K1RHM5_MAGGI
MLSQSPGPSQASCEKEETSRGGEAEMKIKASGNSYGTCSADYKMVEGICQPVFFIFKNLRRNWLETRSFAQNHDDAQLTDARNMYTELGNPETTYEELKI